MVFPFWDYYLLLQLLGTSICFAESQNKQRKETNYTFYSGPEANIFHLEYRNVPLQAVTEAGNAGNTTMKDITQMFRNNGSKLVNDSIMRKARMGLPKKPTNNKFMLRTFDDSGIRSVPIINLPFIVNIEGKNKEVLNRTHTTSLNQNTRKTLDGFSFLDGIHTRLQIASILRDNIVTALGFILNHPKNGLSLDLYATLNDIYNAFRLKRIRTFELIHLVKEIAAQSPTRQFITLFTKVTNSAPKYLKGALKAWLHALNNTRINMDNIFRHKDGPLMIDLLEGIDNGLANILSNTIQFKESSKILAPPAVTRYMGKFIGDIFGALLDKSLLPTQSLVSGIMLHVQLYKFIPDVDEALRYLSEIFLEERPEINFAFHNLSRNGKQNPYSLLSFILEELSRNEQVDSNIREAADTALPHIQRPNRFTVNPNLQVMSPIVSPSKINFSLLFKAISHGEYPDDIVQAMNLILGAINRNEIDMNLVLKGFVRYDYLSPLDLMVAIVDRLRRRTFLPVNIIDAINSLHVHLKLKSAHANTPLNTYKTFDNIMPLFDGFTTPSIPRDIQDQSRVILEELSRENEINWRTELAKYPFIQNSRPRQIVSRLLDSLVTNGHITDPDLVASINEFLALLTPEGDPKRCPLINCPSEASPIIFRITTTTTTPQPPKTSVIPKTAENIDIHDLFNAIDIGYYDEGKIAPIEQFLLSPPGISLIRRMNFTEFKTRGSLLAPILKALSQDPKIHKDPKMNLTVWSLKDRVLPEGSGAAAVKWRKSIVTFVVNMDGILKALDTNELEKDGESETLENVYGFFHKSLQAKFLSTFDVTAPKTRHEFLYALFKHLSNDDEVPLDVREDINVLVNYIQETGAGSQPPDIVSVAAS